MILDKLFGRERRAISENDFPWMDEYGVRSDSGLSITYDKAMRYAPWWRGINLVSTDVAKLPRAIFKRVGEGKERDTKHPAYSLVRRKVNGDMTARVFIQTLTANAMSAGNGYAWLLRDRRAIAAATPLEMRWLDPCATYPVRENERLFYVTYQNGTWKPILPDNMFHLRGLGYDGMVGYSVFSMARETLGLGLGAQKYGAIFFKNNARPNVVVQVPNNMTPEAQKTFLDQWNRMHGGLEEAHKTAILTNGATINPFSINARDSQLIETRQFEIREVANWLGVPPHKVGDTTRTAYASLEQENHAYLVESLDPWLCAWEDEWTHKLLTEEEQETESHVVEFNRNALVRASFAERMQGYNTALNSGWLSKDEIRNKENMNPLPNGEGQKFYAPLNMAQVGGDAKPPTVQGGDIQKLQELVKSIVAGEIPPEAGKVMIKAAYPMMSDADIDKIVTAAEEREPPVEPAVGQQPAPKPEADDEKKKLRNAHRQVVTDIAERMTKRVGIAARKAAKRPKDFMRWIDEELPMHVPVIADALTPAIEAVRCTGLDCRDSTEIAAMNVAEWREALLQIAGSFTEDKLAAAAEQVLNGTDWIREKNLINQVLGDN